MKAVFSEVIGIAVIRPAPLFPLGTAILLSLPLSLIGVVLALILTRGTLNLMSMMAVILLIGVVAKNATLLIDFAKWAQDKGFSRREALIQSGRVRLRPILMTTFAMVAGMAPVALGGGEGSRFLGPLSGSR